MIPGESFYPVRPLRIVPVATADNYPMSRPIIVKHGEKDEEPFIPRGSISSSISIFETASAAPAPPAPAPAPMAGCKKVCAALGWALLIFGTIGGLTYIAAPTMTLDRTSRAA